MLKRLPVLPTIVVAIAVATMIGLGVWQLQRAAWKNGLLARLEAQGGPGGNVEPEAVTFGPVERQLGVDLEKMRVRPDLHGAVAGVVDAQRDALPARVELEFARLNDPLARNHA